MHDFSTSDLKLAINSLLFLILSILIPEGLHVYKTLYQDMLYDPGRGRIQFNGYSFLLAYDLSEVNSLKY